MHRQLAAALDEAHDRIREIQRAAREDGDIERRPWPMILLVTPKGWTGPKVVDGLQVEGTWRAHQVPLAGDPRQRRAPADARGLDAVLPAGRAVRRRRPLVARAAGAGARGRPADERQPARQRRPAARPAACCRTSAPTPSTCRAPGASIHEPTRVLGQYLVDVMRDNPDNFRIFGPDETASNRLDAVYAVTDKVFAGEILPVDEHLARSGRVVEILSEHTCQGWLEGYLLTGRHGLFSCYEAFIHLIDSMFNQHAKWLKTTREIGWRPPIASLNYLLTSHVWRQDHNGFSHQDPGFIDHVVNKKAEVVRVYLPPDTNTLLSTMRHCLATQHYVNVIVAGKQPSFDWLDAEAADLHCARGLGIWDWASTTTATRRRDRVRRRRPHPGGTAAAAILREHLPELKVRFINVVDLMRLQDESEHPHGLSDRRLRHPLHHGQAGHLRLPRLPLADPPADLPAHQPRQSPRPRLQGGGNHHHAVRHGDDERHGPLPPGHGRHRPGPRPGPAGGSLRQQMVDTRRRRGGPASTATTCPRSRAGPGRRKPTRGAPPRPRPLHRRTRAATRTEVMEVVLEGVRELRFTDGAPVRAASGVARFGDGFLVAQDDATQAAWFRDGPATRVRLLPPNGGETPSTRPPAPSTSSRTWRRRARSPPTLRGVVPRLGLVA